MAARDANGQLTAIGMQQVLAAGGSVLWQGVSITDPTQLPLQSAIDAATAANVAAGNTTTSLLSSINDQFDLLHRRIS